MKLNKLLFEEIQSNPAQPASAPPGFAIAGSALPPDEEANPIGVVRLPAPLRTMSPESKFRYNIDKERELSVEEEKSAEQAANGGDYIKATQLAKKAFDRLHNILDVHVLSGLKTKSFDKARAKARERHDKGAFSGFFVLAADLDNFKWVNKVMGHAGADSAIYFLGDLFKKWFENNPKLGKRVQVFHPHGDEFAVLINALNGDEPLDYKQCQAVVVEIIQAVKGLSTELSSTAWQINGRKIGVQITSSWGLSTTYELANDVLLRGKGEDKETRFFLNVDSTLVQYYKLDKMQGLMEPIADLRVHEEEGGLKPILPNASDGQQHPPVGPVDTSVPASGPTPERATSIPLEQRMRRKSRVMAEAAAPKAPNQKDALAFLHSQRGMAFIQSNPYAWSPEDKDKIAKCRDEQQAYRKNPKFFNPVTGGPLDAAYSPHPSVDTGGSKSAM